jgi:hypothetical protein
MLAGCACERIPTKLSGLVASVTGSNSECVGLIPSFLKRDAVAAGSLLSMLSAHTTACFQAFEKLDTQAHVSCQALIGLRCTVCIHRMVTALDMHGP